MDAELLFFMVDMHLSLVKFYHLLTAAQSNMIAFHRADILLDRGKRTGYPAQDPG